MLNVCTILYLAPFVFSAAPLLSALLLRKGIHQQAKKRMGGRLVFSSIEREGGWLSVTSILLCDSEVKKCE